MPSVVPLVRIAHEVESDRNAVQRIVEWIAGELRTSRVDLVSSSSLGCAYPVPSLGVKKTR